VPNVMQVSPIAKGPVIFPWVKYCVSIPCAKKSVIFHRAKDSVIMEREISPVTSLEWPTGFQEVKVPRFHYNGTG
jgi:hypothetical protein